MAFLTTLNRWRRRIQKFNKAIFHSIIIIIRRALKMTTNDDDEDEENDDVDLSRLFLTTHVTAAALLPCSTFLFLLSMNDSLNPIVSSCKPSWFFLSLATTANLHRICHYLSLSTPLSFSNTSHILQQTPNNNPPSRQDEITTPNQTPAAFARFKPWVVCDEDYFDKSEKLWSLF